MTSDNINALNNLGLGIAAAIKVVMDQIPAAREAIIRHESRNYKMGGSRLLLEPVGEQEK